jgi:hypothetical protein
MENKNEPWIPANPLELRDTLIELLQTKYPKIFLRRSEDFGCTAGGIYVSAEDGIEGNNELRLFDYYTEDYEEKYYIFGVNKELVDIFDEHEWYSEWQNPGSVILWPAW